MKHITINLEVNYMVASLQRNRAIKNGLVQLDANTRVEQLISDLGFLNNQVLVVINGAQGIHDQVLQAGDRVVVLPCMSGG